MRRFGTVLKVKPGKLEEYRRWHQAVWPEIVQMGRDCGIRNQTIYHRDGYLFRYFEYVGDDWDADVARMAANPKNAEWWELMMPLQEPIETATAGEWWVDM